MSKKYDREKLLRDDRLLEKICCEDAESDGLSAVYLQIMINRNYPGLIGPSVCM